MQIYKEKIYINGKLHFVDSIRVDEKAVIVTGKLIKIAKIKGECHENILNPSILIENLTKSNLKADIFTFLQGLPEIKPKFPYYMKPECFAVLPIKNFNHWWEKQIKHATRNSVRRAQNRGVVVKLVEFNNQLIKEILNVFNESPMRQGKPFWHYGKDFNSLKSELSQDLYRSDFIGAYYNNELIGFIKLVYCGMWTNIVLILSMIKHRDKASTNLLIAKAVEICNNKRIPYLVYANWDNSSLTVFKQRNGFEKIFIPRYFFPITLKGKIVLKLHAHHSVNEIFNEKAPLKLQFFLKNLRKKWYEKKFHKACE